MGAYFTGSFKSTTLLGKDSTPIADFVSKVPQDNTTIFEYLSDSAQIDHAVNQLSETVLNNINTITNKTTSLRFTIADNPNSKDRLEAPDIPDIAI